MSDRTDRALRLLLADRLLDVLDDDPLGVALLGAAREDPTLLRALLDVEDVRVMRGLVGRAPAPLRAMLIEALISIWAAAADDEIAQACAIDEALVEDYATALGDAYVDPRGPSLAELASVVSWDVVITALLRHLPVSAVADALVDSWPLESSGDHADLLAEVERRARWKQRVDLIGRLLDATGPTREYAYAWLDMVSSERLIRDGIITAEEGAALDALRVASSSQGPEDELRALAKRALQLLTS